MLKNILIVEDEEIFRNMLTKKLEKNNYSVWTAINGVGCLNILKEKIPDLILMDCFMPQMDGLATLNFLKNHTAYKNIPVIMMSSDNINSYGCPFIKKPFTIEVLLDTISKFHTCQYL